MKNLSITLDYIRNHVDNLSGNLYIYYTYNSIYIYNIIVIMRDKSESGSTRIEKCCKKGDKVDGIVTLWEIIADS